jgi:hypothetical protein
MDDKYSFGCPVWLTRSYFSSGPCIMSQVRNIPESLVLTVVDHIILRFSAQVHILKRRRISTMMPLWRRLNTKMTAV